MLPKPENDGKTPQNGVQNLKVYVLLHELWLQTYMFEKLFMVIELLIEVVAVKNYMDPLLKHSS